MSNLEMSTLLSDERSETWDALSHLQGILLDPAVQDYPEKGTTQHSTHIRIDSIQELLIHLCSEYSRDRLFNKFVMQTVNVVHDIDPH